MALLRIILFLILFTPVMLFLSGCYSDTFLDAMREEEDFIAPFDVVLNDELTKRTVYYPISDTGSSAVVRAGDDESYVNIPSEKKFVNNLNINFDTAPLIIKDASSANPPDITVPSYAITSADDIVEDEVTGLAWTRCSFEERSEDAGITYEIDDTDGCTGDYTDGKMAWSQAIDACESLNSYYKRTADFDGDGTIEGFETDVVVGGYGGYQDWRLARVTELLSIVDYDHIDPAIDETYFPNTQNAVDEGYWTYTSKLFIDDNSNTTDNGWVIFFKSSKPQSDIEYPKGSGDFWPRANIVDFRQKLKNDLTLEKHFVRCVRGGID